MAEQKHPLLPMLPGDPQAIADILTHAPCPSGIPQAQARAAMIQRFTAFINAKAEPVTEVTEPKSE